MKWIFAQMAIGVMIAIAVAITTQTSAAMSESDTLFSGNMSAQSDDNNDRIVKMQALSEAKPFLVQESPPVAERAMWMMSQSGGEPTWALVLGGMMLGGAAIMASSSHDDDDGHGTGFMPVMMAVMGTGMLIYYFVSDDQHRTTQPVGGDRYQAWHQPFSLGIQRDAVRATATWRW